MLEDGDGEMKGEGCWRLGSGGAGGWGWRVGEPGDAEMWGGGVVESGVRRAKELRGCWSPGLEDAENGENGCWVGKIMGKRMLEGEKQM